MENPYNADADSHCSRGWVYAKKGDYHRNLDPNWSYAPTYLIKMDLVRKVIETLPEDARILDAGCGEGVLVEEYSRKGRRFEGLDLNYESQFVDQGTALKELIRILKPEGHLITSIPNIAHLNSRFRLMFKGNLDRADSELDHPGERSYHENRRMLEGMGLKLVSERGITFTLPLVWSRLIRRQPAKFRWIHDLLQVFARPALALVTFQTWLKPGQRSFERP